jgi:ATP-binding cassette subfamily B (MDR/TAP) protein 1
MSSPNRNISSPRTPPRQSSPANVNGPSTPPQSLYTSTPSTYNYNSRENARYPSNTLSPTTPARQISSNLNTRVPSTLARAINTSLPSTPPTQRTEYFGEAVELTTLRRSLLRNQSQHSPFHDRHSVAEAIDEDPFEYHSPSGNKLKTMSKYQFSGTSPKVHQEEFGGELHEVRPVSEARRSLYSPQPPIPMSTMQDHPDLFPSIMADPTPPTARPPRMTEPIKPRFRDLLILSQKRDIIFDLLPAVILAIAGSLVQPYMSVIIGEAFAVFSNYPTQLSEAGLEQNMALSAGVIKSSIKLTVAGLIAMLLNYIKGALWIRHGEGVVARLREAVFVGVQGKKMEWFDLGMGINPDEKDEEGRKLEAIGAGGLMAKFTK